MGIIQHICNKISELIDTGEFGSDSEIARKLGCHRPQISLIRSGNRRRFDIEFLLRVCRVLRKPLNYFLPKTTHRYFYAELASRSTDTPTREVAVLGRVMAGPLDEIWMGTEIETHELPASWLDAEDPDRYYLLLTQGTSMIGHGIFEGDMLLVDDRPTELHQGDIVAVHVQDEETPSTQASRATLKQIWDVGTHYILAPANRNAPLIILRAGARIKISKVVRLIRSFE